MLNVIERRFKMKFSFKKITSVLASVVMLGSTMGFAAATTYPAPFVSGGVANVGIVVTSGTYAGSNDLWAAMDLGNNLNTYLLGNVIDTPTTISGEGVNMATGSRGLYYGDSINVARTTLTESELPTVLADGTFTDLAGTEYTYSQTIVPGNTVTAFGTSGGTYDDPVIYLDVGYDENDPLYNYTLTFNKNLNVSDADNVQGEKINILGVDYVVGAGSSNSTLKLYGSGETVVVSPDAPATPTINEKQYNIEMVNTGSGTSGKISVDGLSRSVTKGNAYTFAGGLTVYVKDISNPSIQGDTRSAELVIGANSLTLENGKAAKTGSDLTTIKKTKVKVTAADVGVISGFTVQVAGPDSKNDSLAAGDAFVDPVFGGLSVQFAGEIPALDAETRNTIKVDTDNNQYGYVTFTSARAGSVGEYQLTYAVDNTTSSSTVLPLLAADTTTVDGKGFIRVVESTNLQEGDYMVINQGDAGTIVYVDEINVDIDQTAGNTVTLKDAITGDSTQVTLSNSTIGFTKETSMFGGTGYVVTADHAGTYLNISWDGTTATSVFPRIKLRNGGWMALLTEASITNNTGVILPEGQTTLETDATTLKDVASSQVINGINWTMAQSGTTITINGISTANGLCNFTSASGAGPAILFIEPKKWDDSSYGDIICVPMTTTGTTEIKIDDPKIGGTNSGFITLNSDTYQKEAVDKYGSLITKEDRTNENGVATISYPASQMTVDASFTKVGTTVTPGSGGSSGGGATIGSAIKTDAEIASIQDKNLIVIGGSCVNTVAADLLGGAYCGAEFTEATKGNGTGVGADQFLIQVFNNENSPGKIAMLVAGYEAADTNKAVAYIKDTTTKLSTDVGTEKKLVSATFSEVE
jgi:hypothetical protein